MLIRVLPLIAGVAPIVGIHLAFLLGVSNDVLPSCIPYVEGCTSISATGRRMPGSLMFRAVMLPQAVVLAFLWFFSVRWLDALSPRKKSTTLILASGLFGALALILYVTFLGTKQPFYELMRRFGIYLYFLGTAVAQLALAITLFKLATREAMQSLRRYAVVMLWFCALPFALGILNVILKSVLENADHAENLIEWNVAIVMQGYFLVLYSAWRATGFTADVRVS